MNEHKRILTASAIIVNRIAQILDENQISSIIKDNTESARLAGFGTYQNDVDLYVLETDFERAQKLIEESMP